MLEIYKELNKINVGNKKLTLGDKYIWRPISHILLSPLIYLGFKNPNTLTIISIISLFLGLLINEYWLVYFVIWAILDCADGSLARYNINKGLCYKNGELIDAIGGYFFIVTFWLKIYLIYGFEMCILTIIFNLLARTIYLKFNLTNNKKESNQMSRSSKLYFIYENIEFGSFMLIIFWVSQVLDLEYYFSIGYFLLSLLLLVYSLYTSFKDFNSKIKIN